ncbi:hypothetical protein HY373_00440 [Candidatus Berkelbacteria bacterium]|nr:hypothetical protein [Candidatus Berkelbacteria bacterium]MBI2588402.1 hypothetical protein [Candidatus Berkelbacteria bacterium]MBI4029636.1 hypothetical protein [Candidatus Berkelbacteria bacterium]
MKESSWGILLILALVLGFGWFFGKTKPNAAAVSERLSKDVISATLFQSPELKILSALKMNGALPVEVSTSEVGRDNPFGGL